MKKLFFIIILTLSFQTLIKADDIKEFTIEDISIGDSLFDHFTKKQIKNFFKVTYPSSETFIGWETDETVTFKEYTAMTFHVKSNDDKMEIFSIKGMLDYPNKIKECLKKKKEIVNQIEKNLSYIEQYSYEGDFAKKFGESIAYVTDFDLSGGNAIRVWCSTWDKDHKDSKFWVDTLNVSVGTKIFFDFLNYEAYK